MKEPKNRRRKERDVNLPDGLPALARRFGSAPPPPTPAALGAAGCEGEGLSGEIDGAD